MHCKYVFKALFISYGEEQPTMLLPVKSSNAPMMIIVISIMINTISMYYSYQDYVCICHPDDNQQSG